MNLKEYLGDSVYAEYDGSGIILTTDNGNGPSNTIYLEREVYDALKSFQESLALWRLAPSSSIHK